MSGMSIKVGSKPTKRSSSSSKCRDLLKGRLLLRSARRQRAAWRQARRQPKNSFGNAVFFITTLQIFAKLAGFLRICPPQSQQSGNDDGQLDCLWVVIIVKILQGQLWTDGGRKRWVFSGFVAAQRSFSTPPCKSIGHPSCFENAI